MMDEDDDFDQEESSSRHLLGAVEELLQRSENHLISKVRQRIPYRSKSADNLLIHRSHSINVDSSISETAQTQFDLSTCIADDFDDLPIQRSRSEPISTRKVYDQELAPFLHGDEEPKSQSFTDHFVYNVDLSHSNKPSGSSSSRTEIFSDDDFSSNQATDEPFVSLLHSSLLKTCLTITEEQEEELEEMPERLATIYESPSPQTVRDENQPENLIVYNLGQTKSTNSSGESMVHVDETSPSHSSSASSSSLPVTPTPNIPASNVKETSTKKTTPLSNHVQIMKMIPSSTSSLSDFITPVGASNTTPRYPSEEISTIPYSISSTGTSSSSSTSDEKLRSHTDFHLDTNSTLLPERRVHSLRTISSSSNILYPIELLTPPESDHVIKTPSSSKENVDTHSSLKTLTTESKQHQNNYRQILIDMSIIKKKLLNIETRLNETMRELEIEQALIEGEHQLVFKQILNASEHDQDRIRQSHEQLQLLIQRIMTDKTSIRKQIEATQTILLQLDAELQVLDDQYPSSDESIFKKKQFLLETQKKYEDLEFQLMELETRCEVELEQAEEHFQTEQRLMTENAQLRQNLLRDLDHQQYMVMFQVTAEKERLEREKQRLKLLLEQKKLEAHQCEEKHFKTPSHSHSIYQSIPIDLQSSLNDQRTVLSPKSPSFRPKKVLLDECQEEHFPSLEIKLRDRNRIQERPLTRYLPIRSMNFDLRAHIEGAGHCLDSPHLLLTSTSCRGFLYKMGGFKFKVWNRRWFFFDRQRRSLSYYQDKNESKVRGIIDFQSIVEVYVDHLQSHLLRLPVPREGTFVVKTHQRTYYLVAPTVEAMRIWVDVLITGAEGNTFAGQN